MVINRTKLLEMKELHWSLDGVISYFTLLACNRLNYLRPPVRHQLCSDLLTLLLLMYFVRDEG